MSLKIKNKQDFLTLLVANLFTLAAYMLWGGSALQAMWVFWVQSAVIGVIHYRRLRFGKVPDKYYGAYFLFKLWYGIWFAVSLWFLIFASVVRPFPIIVNEVEYSVDLGYASFSILLLFASSFLFAFHHIQSYRHEGKKLKINKKDVFRPFRRIFPMFLIIMFGPALLIASSGEQYFFAFFILLKIAMDMGMFAAKTSHPH